MINPVYQKLVINTVQQQLMPLTKDRKLTEEDLRNLANQQGDMPEPVFSVVSFLLNSFSIFAKLGDKDEKSISEQDLAAFGRDGIDLTG